MPPRATLTPDFLRLIAATWSEVELRAAAAVLVEMAEDRSRPLPPRTKPYARSSVATAGAVLPLPYTISSHGSGPAQGGSTSQAAGVIVSGIGSASSTSCRTRT